VTFAVAAVTSASAVSSVFLIERFPEEFFKQTPETPIFSKFLVVPTKSVNRDKGYLLHGPRVAVPQAYAGVA
jgi:hypothetical protein